MKGVQIDNRIYTFSSDEDYLAWEKVRASCPLFDLPDMRYVLEKIKYVRDEFARVKVPDSQRLSYVVQSGQLESQLLALDEDERVAYGVFEVLSRIDWAINEVRWDYTNHCDKLLFSQWQYIEMFKINYLRLVEKLRERFISSRRTQSFSRLLVDGGLIISFSEFELNGWAYSWAYSGNSLDDARDKLTRVFEENVDMKNPRGLVADLLGHAAPYFVKELYYAEFQREAVKDDYC